VVWSRVFVCGNGIPQGWLGLCWVVFGAVGANDGSRTRDIQDHNLALYQLSYVRHRRGRVLADWGRRVKEAADRLTDLAVAH
jgi:hypothetical protein